MREVGRMKRRHFIAMAGVLLVLSTPGHGADDDFPERDEIRQSYELTPGARVEVSVIYGPVDIETTDGNTAEVHIVRSARNRADLASRPIGIERTAAGLAVRGER